MDEKASQKLIRKCKENPFVPAGIMMAIGMISWGAYTYKDARRSGLSTSLFLMHLRVKSQSMIVGAMTVGVAYTLLRDHVFYPKTEAEINAKYNGNHRDQ